MAGERLTKDVAATVRSWRIARLELDLDTMMVNITFRSDDGQDKFRQISGEEAAQAIPLINSRDNSAKSLQTWLLEQAMVLWPDDFGGGTLSIL